MTGEADAGKILAVGNAEAEVTRKKTEAMGMKEYAQVQMVKYLSENKVKIVPDILVNGAGEGEGGMLSALMGNELFKNLKKENSGDEKKLSSVG